MRGAFYRYSLRFILVNFLLLIIFIGHEIYLNFEIVSQLKLRDIIWHRDLIKSTIFQNITFNKIYLVLFAISNLYLILWLIKFFKYLNLPYALNIYSDIKQLEGFDKKFKVSHDKFVKKIKHDQSFLEEAKNFSLLFKNGTAINSKIYDKKKDQIAQYLGWDGDIKVYNYKKKGIELFFYKLPTYTKYSLLDLNTGYINLGHSMFGRTKIPLSHVTSMIVVGESGSGKSNYMHFLLQSLFYNRAEIDLIDLIDLKGTELYRYREYQKVNFIDDIELLKDKLIEIRDQMNQRFDQMKLDNVQTYNGDYKFIIIDEIGTIGTNPNKKLKDEIFTLLIELSQKGRAAKVILWIYAQKIDSTNIPSNVLTNLQSKILMRSDSDFNAINTIGKKEDIEKITRTDPADFPKGRAIFKDGISSEKILLQVPFVKFKDESNDSSEKGKE